MNAAIELLKGALEWVRNPAAVEELIAYLEKRRAYIPNYQQRQRAGLWIASTRVEEIPEWACFGTLQTPGDELVATRGAGPAALEACAGQRRTRRLASGRCPPGSARCCTRSSQGRLIAEPGALTGWRQEIFPKACLAGMSFWQCSSRPRLMPSSTTSGFLISPEFLLSREVK